MIQSRQDLLRRLPGVDHVLNLAEGDAFFQAVPRSVLKACARSVIEERRRDILSGAGTADNLDDAAVLAALKTSVTGAMAPNLRRVVNATGVVVHTNLGRSRLADAAIENLVLIAGRYSNLEFDLGAGARGSRYSAVEDILCEITGAESAMAVNNNAGAVLLCLETMAKGKAVVVSRGELVEIGGAFRIPDVMARSGAVLREVGTTNRTHLKDYAGAIDEETALLLKVHKSNYSIVGFTKEVSLKELTALGRERGVPVMEDLGSGTFIDFSLYGLKKEPTVQESVAAGVDLVTFSGDKLLGGPQAGVIVGRKEFMDRIKKNPVTRALRIDKLTLAALESTLRLYRDPEKAVQAIPTLRMMTRPLSDIARQAERLKKMLDDLNDDRLSVDILDLSSRVGGGALPLQDLPSKCLGLLAADIGANRIERFMRAYSPPVIGRIEEDYFVLDPRTIHDEEFPIIRDAAADLLKTEGQ